MFEKCSFDCSKAGLVLVVLLVCLWLAATMRADVNEQVSRLNIDTATLDDVIRIFGKPIDYVWGNQTFTKDDLPSSYILRYPNGFSVSMSHGRVHELRHTQPGYTWQGKLQVGSSLEEVLEAVGRPTETIEGQSCAYKDGVLYKDIDGRKGYCYYSRRDQGVRFFFMNYKVTALYVTRGADKKAKRGSLQTVKPVSAVAEFDDVRWKDLSKLSLSDLKGIIPTLDFNQKTVWPEAVRPFAEELLKKAMNPGLGVRKLHEQGITGKGVNVAIIDQPLYQDHPEFAGKIVAYYDTGCGKESSMHGPAVTSLLVGTNCGTAPDALVYYVAAPSWKRDTAYEARALYWIVEQNKKLPNSQKIRVVSVSAAPSSPQMRDKNQHMWAQACARAEAEGILVLDCTSDHGFIGPCWYDAGAPENVARCTPGFPGKTGFRASSERIHVPLAPRTTAEEYNKGDFSYQYCGQGGLSWSIPYAAGVLALGWQIRPELGPQQMRELLFQSAYKKSDGAKIISPYRFIQLVKSAKTIGWRSGK